MSKKKHQQSRRTPLAPPAPPTMESLPSSAALLKEAKVAFLRTKDHWQKKRGLHALAETLEELGDAGKAAEIRDMLTHIPDPDAGIPAPELYDPKQFDRAVATCRAAMRGDDADAVDAALREYMKDFDRWRIDAEIDDWEIRETTDVQDVLIQNEKVLTEAIGWYVSKDMIDAARKVVDFFEKDMRYLYYVDLAAALARHGRFEEALRFAREVPIDGDSGEFRCDALTEIATAHAARGDEDAVQSVLNEVLALRGIIRVGYTKFCLPSSRVFSTLCEIGYVEQATALKGEMADGISDMLYAMDYPPALALAGREEEALELVWKLNTEHGTMQLADTLRRIGEKIAEKKGPQAAAPVFADLLLLCRKKFKSDPYHQGWAMLETAKVLHEIRVKQQK